jgi:hypothetical protein
MTQKNKLIVGGVVVLALAYYLYDRNKKMKAKEELVAGAETVVAETVDVPSPIINKENSVDSFEQQKQLNFAGGRGKSMTAQYFR